MIQRTPVSIAIARFEDLVSRGLRALIEEDEFLNLVASDVSSERLTEMLETVKPQVVILNFASLSSPSALRELHQNFPATRLVVLADRPTAAECRQMLTFGVTACLTKSLEARDVLHSLHLASRGLHVLPPADSESRETIGPELLTAREAEVLDLLQNGRSNAEIAQTLHVGIETVRTHTRRIYRKLGVRTRRDLRARA
jgi:NarL family two-component system response regulator LiaR